MQMEMMVFLQIIAVIIYANIANKIYRTAFPPRELLLIHGDRPIEDIVNKFESRKDKYKITKCAFLQNFLFLSIHFFDLSGFHSLFRHKTL